jgi:hypothetical protein
VPIVSSQDLDRAAATALVHGYLNTITASSGTHIPPSR